MIWALNAYASPSLWEIMLPAFSSPTLCILKTHLFSEAQSATSCLKSSCIMMRHSPGEAMPHGKTKILYSWWLLLFAYWLLHNIYQNMSGRGMILMLWHFIYYADVTATYFMAIYFSPRSVSHATCLIKIRFRFFLCSYLILCFDTLYYYFGKPISAYYFAFHYSFAFQALHGHAFYRKSFLYDITLIDWLPLLAYYWYFRHTYAFLTSFLSYKALYFRAYHGFSFRLSAAAATKITWV